MGELTVKYEQITYYFCLNNHKKNKKLCQLTTSTTAI